MPVSRSIEVNAPLQSMANAWSYFLEWILVDSRRLLCSELACVEPMKEGMVRFEAIDDAHTLVVFELPVAQGDAAAPSAEELSGRLWQDLALFKEYIETVHMSRRGRRQPQRLGTGMRPTTPRRASTRPLADVSEQRNPGRRASLHAVESRHHVLMTCGPSLSYLRSAPRCDRRPPHLPAAARASRYRASAPPSSAPAVPRRSSG